MKVLYLTENQYLVLLFLLNDEIHRNNADIEKSLDRDFVALMQDENAVIQSILEKIND